MAEAGVHLTSTSANERPSIFELLAQESLMETIRPALRHTVKVLAESNPARLGFLLQHFDELYLLLDLLLQNYYLSHCSASFSENFYGLKRVSNSHTLSLGLPRNTRLCSLLLLCLGSYLRAKLESTLARQRDEEDFSIRLAQTRSQRLYRAALAAYPYVSSAWQLWVFCQQLLFVFGVARTHNPLLWLARVHLARLNDKDMARRGSKSVQPAAGSLLQRGLWLMSQAARGAAVSISTSLSLSVFFLQFLDWFYSSENQNTVKSLTSQLVPAPLLHLQQRDPDVVADTNSCPLCKQLCTNATALSTSGYVFCYRCIYAYVKVHRRCPATGYPTEPRHLIKIYSPES
ncbi:peroxisome assembly protein 12 [Gouania willdenowi]|uniref:Peroxisome assembly protein 12 n=1 Tax=Gouania willdenowi TaxID=441366 RepID=A0A8C5DS76_GOUWI|nr:peroxisome assembly protein 12 [Gouania willdenowi]XP_028310968.1 peroxisome assembly protein 12 [Gouania willdenowi]